MKQRPKTDQWLNVSLKTHSGCQVTNVYQLIVIKSDSSTHTHI